MSDSSHKSGSFFVGVALGAILGGTLVTLLGTDEAKKLIKKIQDEGLDALDTARVKLDDTLEHVQNQAQQEYSKVKDMSDEFVEKGRAAISQMKKMEERIADQTKEEFETVSESVSEKLSALEQLKSEVVNDVVGKADTALSHIEQLQENGRKATATLRKTLNFKQVPQGS